MTITEINDELQELFPDPRVILDENQEAFLFFPVKNTWVKMNLQSHSSMRRGDKTATGSQEREKGQNRSLDS